MREDHGGREILVVLVVIWLVAQLAWIGLEDIIRGRRNPLWVWVAAFGASALLFLAIAFGPAASHEGAHHWILASAMWPLGGLELLGIHRHAVTRRSMSFDRVCPEVER